MNNDDQGERAHSDWVGQPHPADEPEPITQAEAAAEELKSEDHPLGKPGRRFDRHSPFMVGLTATAGVLVTLGTVRFVLAAREVLLLLVAGLFLAIGMEPLISWLVRHRVRRGWAVTLVVVVGLAAVAGFLAAAVPPLIDQGRALIDHAPDQLHRLQDQYPPLRSLAQRFRLDEKLQHGLDSLGGGAGTGGALASGVMGAGRMVFGALSATVIVAVLTIYFSATFPMLRAGIYRLFPHERRPRAILIGDAIFAKVGGYVLGNLLISAITAVLTFIWLAVFDVPFALLLAVLVAVLDLIPLVGSTVAGVIITVVALTVSLPVSVATLGFFLVLRVVEDYLLVPPIMGRTVQVPGLVTVVATLLGGALLGVIGALLAIPAAAAILLLVQELLFPRLDQPRAVRTGR